MFLYSSHAPKNRIQKTKEEYTHNWKNELEFFYFKEVSKGS